MTPDDYDRKALEAEERARTALGSLAKQTWEEVAERWRDMARHARRQTF